MIWPNEYSGVQYDRHNKAGLHCWTLIVDVYKKQLNVTLCPYGDKWARELIVTAKAIKQEFRDGGEWVDVMPGSQREFDVVLMSGHERYENKTQIAIVHVGIMYGANRVVHIEEESEVTCVSIRDKSVANRIVGYKRHISQCL